MKPEYDEIIIEFMKLVDGSIREISFAWKPDCELLFWINEVQLGSEPVLFRFGEDFILGTRARSLTKLGRIRYYPHV